MTSANTSNRTYRANAIRALLIGVICLALQGCGIAFMYCGLERQDHKTPIGCDW